MRPDQKSLDSEESLELKLCKNFEKMKGTTGERENHMPSNRSVDSRAWLLLNNERIKRMKKKAF